MAIIESEDRAIQAEPPRENLVRAVYPADLELRDSGGDMPTLAGHFAVFNQWTEIKSAFEGHFLERIAPGAFAKTLRENGQNLKILFQHGRDPQIGDKVLGIPSLLEEDKIGARYEAPLFDTSYNRDLEPGLRAGAYGSSFRFAVMKEEFVRDPESSDYNPDGLPERTILEARVMEAGPVTFPAYDGATAGVRSLTDDFLTGRFALGTDVQAERAEEVEEVTTTVEAEPTHSETITVNMTGAILDESSVAAQVLDALKASRDTPDQDRRAETTEKEEKMEGSIVEMRARQEEIHRELEDIAAKFTGMVLDESARVAWDALTAETEDLSKRIKETEERDEYLRHLADVGSIDKPRDTGTGTFVTARDGRNKAPDNPHDMTEYHGRSRDHDHLMELYHEGARKAVDSFRFPHERGDGAKFSENIEYLLDSIDGADKAIARRVLTCGSPLYRRAFWKTIAKKPLSSEEQRAMLQADIEMRTEALGLTTGGAVVAVPVQIDPTVILTSNGVMNPIRAISRNIQTTSYAWQGVTTGGVVAQYQAEAATALNNAGTFNNPTIYLERVTSFIPYSYELAQDWGALESELAREISDARDTLEATKFSLGAGHGSNEPTGILVGAGTAVTTSGGTFGTAMSSDDLFAVEAALPARHIPSAAWVSSVGVYQRIRKEDTGGGGRFWVDLRDGTPAQLIGYPAYKSSTIGTTVYAGGAPIAGAVWGVFGNWDRYAVLDRPGMFVRNIPDLFGGTAGIHFPTGQSGLLGFWRNSAGVLDSNAFRVGTVSKGVN